MSKTQQTQRQRATKVVLSEITSLIENLRPESGYEMEWQRLFWNYVGAYAETIAEYVVEVDTDWCQVYLGEEEENQI